MFLSHRFTGPLLTKIHSHKATETLGEICNLLPFWSAYGRGIVACMTKDIFLLVQSSQRNIAIQNWLPDLMYGLLSSVGTYAISFLMAPHAVHPQWVFLMKLNWQVLTDATDCHRFFLCRSVAICELCFNPTLWIQSYVRQEKFWSCRHEHKCLHVKTDNLIPCSFYHRE